MIFLLNGPPASGKDAAALYLKERHGVIPMSFKHELFKKTCEYYGVTLEWFMSEYDNREKKEQPEEKLQGLSRRQALITYSEKIAKPQFGKEIWAKQLHSNLVIGMDHSVSDLGFEIEISFLINNMEANDFCIVQLLREGCDFSNDSRNFIFGKLEQEYVNGHKTSISQEDKQFPVRMYRIHNNGTLEEFYEALEKIYEKERNAKEETEGIFGIPV